jgi:hypothetical protein
MKLHCLGWGVVVSSMLAATFAPAAFAQDAYIGGNTHNGLSSQAFRRNALTTNEDALKLLLGNPLDDNLFALKDRYIGGQLRDRKARAMMEEIVACALDANTRVTATDQDGNPIAHWDGELGLCQRWHTQPLRDSEACQELITACVMARVNAVGKSIALSLRSEAPMLSSLRSRVPVETRFKESPQNENPSEGWPIPSFATECRGVECHWLPEYVGTCKPGTEIQLAIENPRSPRDRSACDSMALRACAGIYGCMGPTVHELPSGAPLPPYSKFLGEKAGACRSSPLTFTCPSDKATAGFFSVMARPHRARPRNEPSRTHTIVVVNDKGTYPAPERTVFGFPEGAFYGNMFKPGELTLKCALNNPNAATATALSCERCDLAPGGICRTCNIDLERGDPVGACSADLVSLPYRDVYACYTYAQQIDEDSSVAAFNKRLCDTPDAKAKCFAYPPQRCHDKNTGTSGPEHSLCEPMGNDGAFGYCTSQVDHSREFRGVITTYLNAPCDLLDEGSLCDAMRSSPHPAGSLPGGPSKVPPGPRGCGGCSLHDSATPCFSLAAVTALVLRRRRRRHTA